MELESDSVSTLNPGASARNARVGRLFEGFRQHWIVPVTVLLGLYALLPFMAPVFMQLGWEMPARLIYGAYSTQCHQLPQRSFFLFGPKGMFSLSEVQAAWQETTNPMILRQFIGNAQMGWKVAWSDRMVAMYLSAFIFAPLWWLNRRRIGRLPWWGFALLLLPMALDGTTHFISDLSGIDQGFRLQNQWLAQLTQNAFPMSFYAGDALGSFNNWMRLISGILFGLGLVWFGFPILDEIIRGRAVNYKKGNN